MEHLFKLFNPLEKVQWLILDDFGLALLEQNTRLTRLPIIEERYEKKSVIIASQLPIAIMDRLFANTHHFKLKSNALRKKNSKNNQKIIALHYQI